MFSKIFGRDVKLTNIVKLQEKKKQLEEKKVTSWVSAVLKHHELQIIQERIDHALLGDTVSRTVIQDKLTVIESLETKIKELTTELNEKKIELNHYVFGPTIKN